MPGAAPHLFTLRLKHHRTTILLNIDPLSPLSTLKTELHNALTSTTPSLTLNGRALPSSPSAYALAKARDPANPEKGWVRIDAGGSGDEAAEEQGKGKGKGKWAADTVKGAGVKDHMPLAFAWETEEEREARMTAVVEEGADNDKVDDDDFELDEEEEEEKKGKTKEWVPQWDVVWPSWEDQYGVESVGDVDS